MKLFYYIINFVVIALVLTLSFVGIITLAEATTLVVLSVTAIAIGMQAFATRRMAESQLMPAINVNMVYEGGKTYFWFQNYSNTPAIVSFEIKKKEFKQSLRISPQQKMCTSSAYDFKPLKEEEIDLDVSVESAFKNFNTKIEFKKSYKFHEFQSGLYRWDESSWGFPDLPWPGKSI